MTDKEIAFKLMIARDIWVESCKASITDGDYYYAGDSAKNAVHIIHHIINSINWED